MLSRSHQICSIALVEAFALYTGNQMMSSFSTGFSLLVATAIGASIPDVDQPTSKINHWLPINLGHIFKHRGITHTILGWLVFSFLLFFLMNKVRQLTMEPKDWWSCFYIGLSAGYLLHLAEDYFSNRSLYLFTPVIVPKGRGKTIGHWWGPGYEVGGIFETVCRYLALVMVIFMTISWLSQLLAYQY